MTGLENWINDEIKTGKPRGYKNKVDGRIKWNTSNSENHFKGNVVNEQVKKILK